MGGGVAASSVYLGDFLLRDVHPPGNRVWQVLERIILYPAPYARCTPWSGYSGHEPRY